MAAIAATAFLNPKTNEPVPRACVLVAQNSGLALRQANLRLVQRPDPKQTMLVLVDIYVMVIVIGILVNGGWWAWLFLLLLFLLRVMLIGRGWILRLALQKLSNSAIQLHHELH